MCSVSGRRRRLASHVVGCVCLLGAVAGCSKTEADSQVGAASLHRSEAGDGLVISQVYGGAGSTGALFNRDFVELFNRTSSPIALRGLSIHVASQGSDFAIGARLPEGAVVPPGGYYLVGFAAGLTGEDLRPDGAGHPIDILPVNGKVAIARDTSAPSDPAAVLPLVCGRPNTRCASDRLVDLVGFGLSSDREGAAAAPAAGVKLAVLRKGAGCVDTDDNRSDFETAAPAPRTSTTPAHLCGEGTR
jgi:uncharacterized protein